jgi:hypothetical protein
MNDDSCIPAGCDSDSLFEAIDLVSYDFVQIPIPANYDGASWRSTAWRYIHFLNGLRTWQARAPAVDALLRFLCGIEGRHDDLTELLIRKLSALLTSSPVALPVCQALYDSITVKNELAESISRVSSPGLYD